MRPASLKMLRLANQMRESDGRQRLYRLAAAEAEKAVDLYHKQQANIAAAKH